ncbi:MAG: hypothetical protein AAGD25_24500 [Cyanobacteria bacterium P01_F01_bin.150]
MIFPDHADSLLFYYQPLRPQLVWREGIPQLNLIQYKGQGQEGGLLTLEADLSISSQTLEALRRELGGPGIRLVPVPLEKGTATLTILDRDYGEQAISLLSGNNVVFSAWLDTQAITIVEQVLRQSDRAPIALFYSLEYVSLRPAYSFRLRADWERVQRRIEEHIGVGLFVLSVDVEKIVESLVDERVIEVEFDTFIANEDLDEQRIKDRDRLLTDIQEMILHTFFEPKLQPIEATIDGDPPLFGFSYRVIDIQQVARRSLNATVNEQTIVHRSLYPQAYLEGIASKIQAQGLDPDTFIQRFDLEIPFFRKRQVSVIARCDFEADGIEWITVQLTYQGNTQTLLLTTSDDRQPSKPWNGVLNDNGQIERDVEVTYTVRFRNVDTAQRPAELTSAPRVTPFDYVEIVPRQLYTIQPIPIVAMRSFPWDRYGTVKVRLRYWDEVNQIRLEPTIYLDAERRSHLWSLFAQNRNQQRFQYQLTFIRNPDGISGQDVYLPWRETQDQVLISQPFAQQRRLTVVSLLSWEVIREVYVQVSYRDPVTEMTEQQILHFDQSDHHDKVFRANAVKADVQIIQYWMLVVFKEGGITWKIPQSQTIDNRLYLDNLFMAHRVVIIKADQVDFEANSIQTIQIELNYKRGKEDIQNDDVIRIFEFDEPTDSAYFEFDFSQHQSTSYHYQVTYQFSNDEVRKTEWIQSSETTLHLEARSLESFDAIEAENLHIEISSEGLNWEQVRTAKLRFWYVDDEAGVEEKEKITFRESSDPIQTWTVHRDRLMAQFYSWKVSFTMKDKELGDRGKLYYPGPGYKPWHETDNPKIILKDYLDSFLNE